MHKMEETPKILTIVGLIVEGLAFVFFGILAVVFRTMASIPKADLLAEGMAEMDADLFLSVTHVFSIIFIVIGVVLLTMFMVNLVLFTKLIKGHFDEEAAVKLYIYQAIWGGISLLFNTITGILYLISAIQAQNRKRSTKPREGI